MDGEAPNPKACGNEGAGDGGSADFFAKVEAAPGGGGGPPKESKADCEGGGGGGPPKKDPKADCEGGGGAEVLRSITPPGGGNANPVGDCIGGALEYIWLELLKLKDDCNKCIPFDNAVV